MPLPEAYNKQIDSMIADMKNTGGRPGGSITAALFLQKYVNNTPWAHLDIASTRLEEALVGARRFPTARSVSACGC
jgi:leucyl aminopeptidase